MTPSDSPELYFRLGEASYSVSSIQNREQLMHAYRVIQGMISRAPVMLPFSARDFKGEPECLSLPADLPTQG